MVARESFQSGRYREAVVLAGWAHERKRDWANNAMLLIASLMTMGKEQEARARTAEFLKIKPKFSMKEWVKTQGIWHPPDLERAV